MISQKDKLTWFQEQLRKRGHSGNYPEREISTAVTVLEIYATWLQESGCSKQVMTEANNLASLLNWWLEPDEEE